MTKHGLLNEIKLNYIERRCEEKTEICSNGARIGGEIYTSLLGEKKKHLHVPICNVNVEERRATEHECRGLHVRGVPVQLGFVKTFPKRSSTAEHAGKGFYF